MTRCSRHDDQDRLLFQETALNRIRTCSVGWAVPTNHVAMCGAHATTAERCAVHTLPLRSGVRCTRYHCEAVCGAHAATAERCAVHTLSLRRTHTTKKETEVV